MKLNPLTSIELHILNHAMLRCLIAKRIISKEDLMADLVRQGIDAEVASRIKAVLDQIPEK